MYTLFSMWDVYEHRSVAKQLKKLPVEMLKRYEKWKDIVRISGQSGLKAIRGFNDEPLSGQWLGHRSSRLNKQYRVIYKIDQDNVYVFVEKVTAHDDRKK